MIWQNNKIYNIYWRYTLRVIKMFCCDCGKDISKDTAIETDTGRFYCSDCWEWYYTNEERVEE
jgi:hypothetical protein